MSQLSLHDGGLAVAFFRAFLRRALPILLLIFIGFGIAIGQAVLTRIRDYAIDSPFLINSVVVGNVQYPSEVADAVSRKLAATQELERKDTEIAIEGKERTKREVQATGIANAMRIIRGQLNALYIQHEAIEAQKLMVNSPNHTTVYIPVGPMGVPLTGTFVAPNPSGSSRDPR